MPAIVRLAMLLQAALNGDRAPSDHPAVAITPEQLAADELTAWAAATRAT